MNVFCHQKAELTRSWRCRYISTLLRDSKANENVALVESCYDKISHAAAQSHAGLKFELFGTCYLHPHGTPLPYFSFVISQRFLKGVNQVKTLLQEIFTTQNLSRNLKIRNHFWGLMKLICRYFLFMCWQFFYHSSLTAAEGAT